MIEDASYFKVRSPIGERRSFTLVILREGDIDTSDIKSLIESINCQCDLQGLIDSKVSDADARYLLNMDSSGNDIAGRNPVILNKEACSITISIEERASHLALFATTNLIQSISELGLTC